MYPEYAVWALFRRYFDTRYAPQKRVGEYFYDQGLFRTVQSFSENAKRFTTASQKIGTACIGVSASHFGTLVQWAGQQDGFVGGCLFGGALVIIAICVSFASAVRSECEALLASHRRKWTFLIPIVWFFPRKHLFSKSLDRHSSMVEHLFSSKDELVWVRFPLFGIYSASLVSLRTAEASLRLVNLCS